MEIYQQKSRWKFYLAISGIVIMIISVVYTNYIASRLAEGERNKVELYFKALASINSTNSPAGDQVIMELEVLSLLKNIPVILVDETGNISMSQNFAKNADLNKELEKIKASGQKPVEGEGYGRYAYYKQTRLLTLLSYFPIIQILLLLGFIAVGYFGFSTARKAEQNQVWVGMAKETAHQLGTPISAIIAWLEHLKLMKPEDKETMEIVTELENDVDRLNLIADRFSKIGSAPILKSVNVATQLNDCRQYMEKRASRKVVFDYPAEEKVHMAKVNPPLFNWVIENLIRNSLDSMGGKGTISAVIAEENHHVIIELSDTGKGIPSNNFKTVFEPGFTTKKRGWGLGLSLAKRIIETYHSGKIFVKSSVVNKGTTFTIKLLKA